MYPVDRSSLSGRMTAMLVFDSVILLYVGSIESLLSCGLIIAL